MDRQTRGTGQTESDGLDFESEIVRALHSARVQAFADLAGLVLLEPTSKMPQLGALDAGTSEWIDVFDSCDRRTVTYFTTRLVVWTGSRKPSAAELMLRRQNSPCAAVLVLAKEPDFCQEMSVP